MSELLLGIDPELFLTVGDKFVSAHGLFPGTKWEPFKVDKGAIQVDGLALEFNIDPAKTRTEFNNNIRTVLVQMNEMVREVDKDMKLNFVPVARFDPKEFDNFSDEAKMLGCDPDFNITGDVNPSPEELINMPLRTASGHIHLGWREPGEVDPYDLEHFGKCVQTSRFFFEDKENPFAPMSIGEKIRLEYYGNNGAFRPKTYGVELRQYSNAWVAYEESRMKMFDYITEQFKRLENEMRNS